MFKQKENICCAKADVKSLEFLRNGIKKHGVPKEIYVDDGNIENFINTHYQTKNQSKDKIITPMELFNQETFLAKVTQNGIYFNRKTHDLGFENNFRYFNRNLKVVKRIQDYVIFGDFGIIATFPHS